MRNWNGSGGLGQLTPSDDENGDEETGAEDEKDENGHQNGQTVSDVYGAVDRYDSADIKPFDCHCQQQIEKGQPNDAMTSGEFSAVPNGPCDSHVTVNQSQ